MLSRIPSIPIRTTLRAGRQLTTEAAAASASLSKNGQSSGSTNTNKAVNAATTKTKGSSTGGRDTLGRRLMSLVHGKRKAVITIQMWKEEGRTVRKFEICQIVRQLRKLKRYKHALEVCEWMTRQENMKLVSGDYAVHLDLLGKVHGLNAAEKFFEDLPDNIKNEATYTALLHTYVQEKLSGKAEAVMKRMLECGFLKNPLPYNHMLSLYLSTGELEKVAEMIQDLKENMSPDIVTYTLWLTACASQNNVEAAERVFRELRKAKIEPDWVAFSVLSNLYIKNDLPEKAASTLKEIEFRASKKSRAAYSSLLTIYTNMGDKGGVNRIWKRMKSTFRKMNDAEYTCMISSLVKLGDIKDAESLYAEWESVSGSGDTRVSNILLAAYINTNQIETAETFLNRMEQKGIKPSYTTWELLTWGYLEEEQTQKVLEYFKKAVNSVKTWVPDKKLVGEIFKKLEEKGNMKGAEEFLIVLRNAGFVNTETYNSLLRTYAAAGRMPLVVEERMMKDGVKLDEESRDLLKITGKMCVSDIEVSFA